MKNSNLPFGPKNNSENIFKIHTCGSHFLLNHFTFLKGGLLHKITISVTKITFFPHDGISKKKNKHFMIHTKCKFKQNFLPVFNFTGRRPEKFEKISHFVLKYNFLKSRDFFSKLWTVLSNALLKKQVGKIQM